MQVSILVIWYFSNVVEELEEAYLCHVYLFCYVKYLRNLQSLFINTSFHLRAET